MKLVKKLGPGREVLSFCYEAGPCGYGIHRQLTHLGHDCAVVAPSLIPRKAGDRVKTDRRDSESLARLHRAGELTTVRVLDDFSLAPIVRALMALRGVQLIAAPTIVAEIGDLARFASPRQLMSYLGLVPSESSSGAITRCGGRLRPATATSSGSSRIRRTPDRNEPSRTGEAVTAPTSPPSLPGGSDARWRPSRACRLWQARPSTPHS